MGNCLFGYPVFSDANLTYAPSFSGPAWVNAGDVSIANLQDRRSRKVARSVSAAESNTWFDIDLKRVCRVGALGLQYSNISAAGRLRLRGFSALPCFDSLMVGLTPWTSGIGTPVRTAAAFTCSDGITLDLIADDDATATAGEAFFVPVTFTGNAVKALRFRFKPGTNLTDCRVQLQDTTAAATRLNLQIYSTAGVPLVQIVAGTGTLVSSTARGDGSYDVVVLTTAVTAANVHSLRVYPEATVSSVGNIFIGAFTAWDAIADQQVHESGLLDAWPVVYPVGGLPAADPRLRYATALVINSPTVGDAAWTSSGTPTRTAGAFACADGSTLDLIGDDSAVATESYSKAVVFATNGTKTLRFRIARNSAFATHAVVIRDVTATVNRFFSYIDFTTATPSLVPSDGTVISVTAVGDGSWDVIVQMTGIIAANTHSLDVYGAAGGAANVASFYIGLMKVWDVAYADWYTGKYSAEEVAEIGSIGVTHVPTSPPAARYWRVTILDSTNAAGYVELGRLMITGSVQPTLNMMYGAKLGLDTQSTRDVTDGGAAVYTRKAIERSEVFTIDLTEAEAFAQFFEMQWRAGTTEQFLWVHDAADREHMHRRSFPATLKALSPTDFPTFKRNVLAYSVVEDL